MTLDEAVKLGHERGLKTDAECINMVLLHAMNLFKYEEMRAELKELLDEAKQQGQIFCCKCRFAILNGECPECHGIDVSFRDCV